MKFEKCQNTKNFLVVFGIQTDFSKSKVEIGPVWRLKQLKLLEFSLKFPSDSYLVKSTADKKHLVHMSAFVHLGMKHKLPAFFIYR